MRGRTGGLALAAITSITLVAAGCGGGGSEPQPGTSQAGGQGGEISIRSCTPQNPLIPANTNEVCGGNLLDAIDAKLVHYNADTAAPSWTLLSRSKQRTTRRLQ
jgi:oligopeptide transport system substrate-binding protein